MSYDAERIAITRRLEDNNFFGLTPFGFDGDPIKPTVGGGWMNILSGQPTQVSVGKPGNNLHLYPGVLSITIITEGARGSRDGKIFADLIIDNLTSAKIDETGNAPGANPQFVIDFAANGLTPGINLAVPDAPNFRTVVNAPFVRQERR